MGLDAEDGVRGSRYLALVAILALTGCASSGETDLASLASNSDQVIWEAGQKALGKKDWEGARQHFRRIIDGFPQSEFGPAARIALADSYYQEGGTANLILAVPAYRDFLTLYPSHPRSNYAQFMVAETYFAQRNSADRDQSPTHAALEEYLRLLELYPDTQFSEQARTRIAEARSTLARHEFLVGWFYQRTRKACHSAIPRYQAVADNYPDYKQIDEVYYRLAECLGVTGRPAEGLPVVSRMLFEHPQSAFAEEARALEAALRQASTAQPPPSPAAPSPAPSATPE
jgi:outer membrane protein assembly factor BamD